MEAPIAQEHAEARADDLRRALEAADREIATLRARLARESEEREELLTVVSHELRTPVTVIAGYVRLLLSGEVGSLSERQREFLEETHRSCRRLDDFVGRWLRSAREVSAVLDLVEVDLRPTIEAAVAGLQPLLAERKLRLEVDAPKGLPRARCDPPRVEQVLTNLIGNAVKFTPVGGTIELGVQPVEVEGDRFVEIQVTDEGSGLSSELPGDPFEPWVTSGKGGGVGLGLAICKRIVEAHGGVISGQNRPEGGARFAFRLPAVSERAGS